MCVAFEGGLAGQYDLRAKAIIMRLPANVLLRRPRYTLAGVYSQPIKARCKSRSETTNILEFVTGPVNRIRTADRKVSSWKGGTIRLFNLFIAILCGMFTSNLRAQTATPQALSGECLTIFFCPHLVDKRAKNPRKMSGGKTPK